MCIVLRALLWQTEFAAFSYAVALQSDLTSLCQLGEVLINGIQSIVP